MKVLRFYVQRAAISLPVTANPGKCCIEPWFKDKRKAVAQNFTQSHPHNVQTGPRWAGGRGKSRRGPCQNPHPHQNVISLSFGRPAPCRRGQYPPPGVRGMKVAVDDRRLAAAATYPPPGVRGMKVAEKPTGAFPPRPYPPPGVRGTRSRTRGGGDEEQGGSRRRSSIQKPAAWQRAGQRGRSRA